MVTTVIHTHEMKPWTQSNLAVIKKEMTFSHLIHAIMWTDVFITGLQQSLAFMNGVALISDISLI